MYHTLIALCFLGQLFLLVCTLRWSVEDCASMEKKIAALFLILLTVLTSMILLTSLAGGML